MYVQGARSIFEHLPHEYIEPTDMKQAALEGGNVTLDTDVASFYFLRRGMKLSLIMRSFFEVC